MHNWILTSLRIIGIPPLVLSVPWDEQILILQQFSKELIHTRFWITLQCHEIRKVSAQKVQYGLIKCADYVRINDSNSIVLHIELWRDIKVQPQCVRLPSYQFICQRF